MKKIYFILMLLFIANSINAQYSEVWNARSNLWMVGCENMDNDASKEIVTFVTYMDVIEGISIIDGVSGEIEWQSSNDWKFYSASPSLSYEAALDFPKLVDVNSDGKFELLIRGTSPGETSKRLHLFAFGGALTKSTEISKIGNVQIENFPNPFNSVTTIKYNVPVKSMVTVKIYDMNGNEIKSLIDTQQSQGDYEIPFNREDLANGTYFYQVKVGRNVGAKKMVIIE